MRCCRWIVFSSALVREYYYTISLLEKFDSEIKLCIGVLVSFMTNTKIRPQNCISQFSALIRCKNFFIHLCIFSISWVKIFPHTGRLCQDLYSHFELLPQKMVIWLSRYFKIFRVIAQENDGNQDISRNAGSDGGEVLSPLSVRATGSIQPQ